MYCSFGNYLLHKTCYTFFFFFFNITQWSRKWPQIMIWEEDCVIKVSVSGLLEISKLSLNKQTLKDPCRNIVFQ